MTVHSQPTAASYEPGCNRLPAAAEFERIEGQSEQSPANLTALTDWEGTVWWASSALVDLTGSSPVGRSISALAADDAAAMVDKLRKSAVRRGPEPVSGRVAVRWRGDEESVTVHVEACTSPTFDGLLWSWQGSAASAPPELSGDGVSSDSLVEALETIADALDRCGFNSSRPGVTPQVHELAERCHLTTRERQIVGLLAQGLRPNAIGERLFMSPSAVRNHLSAVYRKIGVPNQSALLVRLLGHVDPAL